MAGMPDPKSRVAKIDAAEDAAVNPTAKPAVKAVAEKDEPPITADQAVKNAAKWKADAEAFVKAAGAPKPPGVLDRLKSLVGAK